MYTIVERRTVNRAQLQETMARAPSEYFPKLQQAPGFVGFYLTADEANGINAAAVVWESQAQAAACEPVASKWMQTLEAFGHPLQSGNRGETVFSLDRPR